MAGPDPGDQTLVGEQPWIERQVVIPPGVFPDLTVLPQPPLLDAQTARAVRAACWTWAAVGLVLLTILAIVAAGLAVAMFATGSV
jgi:hypothetical protein